MVTWLKIDVRDSLRHIYSLYIVLVLVALIFFRPSFSSNDDVEVRSILDGTRFGNPDFHIPYINSILTYSFSLLYSEWNTVYWYEIFLTSTTALCCIILCHFLRFTFFKFAKHLYFPFIIMVFILFFKSINSMSYTTSAIYLTGTGIVLFVYYDRCEFSSKFMKLLYIIIMLITLSLGYLTRPTLFIVLLAFLAPSIIFSIAKKRLRNSKIFFMLCASVLIWILNRIGAFAYQDPSWRAWQKFINSVIWPGEYNILSDSINNQSQTLLFSKLGVSESQAQLWMSANSIDPDLFSDRFINAFHEIPIVVDPILVLKHLQQFFFSYWHYLSLLTLIILHRWYLHFLSQKKAVDKASVHIGLLVVTFQYLYGILFLITLITYRKDVERVTIGLVLFLLFVSLVTDIKQENSKVVKFSQESSATNKTTILIIGVCFLLILNTIQTRPGVRNIFGGSVAPNHSEVELTSTKYISNLPQCKGLEFGEPKCILFLHTNSVMPFTRVQKSSISKLYLFWSAFSPKWSQAILKSGRRDSLDLLCSNRGFLLNSKNSVSVVRNYIKEMRNTQINSIPVNSLPGWEANINTNFLLTVGSPGGSC